MYHSLEIHGKQWISCRDTANGGLAPLYAAAMRSKECLLSCQHFGGEKTPQIRLLCYLAELRFGCGGSVAERFGHLVVPF